ncbi:MAG: phosphoglyceromutase [Luteitalea sp.]|nr:phosphoglyceromutase [Luteitalea sp.]
MHDLARGVISGVLVGVVTCAHGAFAQPTVRNVILITMDGVRVEEIFGGLDLAVLESTLEKGVELEEQPAYEKYWAATPEERRVKLMPFFWQTLMRQHGSIAGNRARGSRVWITNRHGFSYPGYSEILVGEAHDEIDSNDKTFYPYPTVLEFLRQRLGRTDRSVAMFGSWETFNWIVQRKERQIFVNAGYEDYDAPGAVIDALNTLQHEARGDADDDRLDAFTFRFAMAHLRRHRPRVLYLAFSETDVDAHQGRYNRLLDTLARLDGYLRELWTFLESDPQYRGQTALLITTDHGRGHTVKDWSEHGKIDGAQDVWQAYVVPGVPLRGEWSQAETVYANQIAATIAQLLGFEYRAEYPGAGKPIAQLFR